ncbi:hypothetical protein RHGRI_007456 [Rhododendron griersonianum]|uniref:At3g06530-like ARM-repeats domain-containing protein n=1 Tax=Rhododendron griersonianum TaxID=479676 RepID=A0AAV6KZV3_9ERIC|nr:hypothetical protein RHGRI_007456 [Rhododendron griersonianum]
MDLKASTWELTSLNFACPKAKETTEFMHDSLRCVWELMDQGCIKLDSFYPRIQLVKFLHGLCTLDFLDDREGKGFPLPIQSMLPLSFLFHSQISPQMPSARYFSMGSVVRERCDCGVMLPSTLLPSVFQALLAGVQDLLISLATSPMSLSLCTSFATCNVNLYAATGPEFMLYATYDGSRFNALYDACYQVLVTEWNVLKSVGLVSAEESKTRMVDGDCKGFLDQLFEANFNTNFRQLNLKILVCLFWRILEVFVSTMSADVSLDDSGKWMSTFQDLFVFFADSEPKNVFQKHLHFLLDESLHFELLGEFPSLLVPLSSDNKDLRVAAMSCIEGLCTLSPHVDYTKWKSGISTMPFLLSEATIFRRRTTLVDLIRTRSAISDVGGANPYLFRPPPTPTSSDECLPYCSDIVSAFSSHFRRHPALFRRRQGSPEVRRTTYDCLTLFPAISDDTQPFSDDAKARRRVHFKGFVLSEVVFLVYQRLRFVVTFSTLFFRFNQSIKNEKLIFVLRFALKLSPYAKRVILSKLKGLGRGVTRVEDVELLLSELLERCRRYHFGKEKSFKKLSKVEVETLCLPLESCAVPTSSFDEPVFEDQLLEALQPCISVLRNLNTSFYRGLKTEKQDQLFQDLVLLFRSANGDIQNATREALLRIKVSFLSLSLIHDSKLPSPPSYLLSRRSAVINIFFPVRF